jgi:hypothetical protein
VAAVTNDASGQPFRFIAEEAFSLTGRGTTVIGSIASGAVAVGDLLRFEGESVIPPFVCEGVSGVRVADWKPDRPATVALLLPTLDKGQVVPGDVLVAVSGSAVSLPAVEDDEAAIAGWTFDVEETSAGAYLVTGTDSVGRSVRLRGDEPEPLLAEARRWLRSVAG